MKNAFIALALVLVCSTAFASQEAETKARLQKIASTSFGKTILETIQVELQSKEDPRPRIIQLLEELVEEQIQAQARADADFQAATDDYNSNAADIASQLEDNHAEVEEKTELISDLNGQLDALNSELEIRENDHAAKTAELEAAQEAWEAAHAAWEAEDRRLGRILEILGKVRSVITQRLATRYDEEFLQSGHAQLLSAFAEIKETVNDKAFKKMSPGFSRMISFITMKTEAHLSQDFDAEAEAALTSVVTLIDSISAGVEEVRATAEEKHTTDFNIWTETSERINTALHFNQARMDEIRNTITDLTSRINTATEDIANAQDRIAQLEEQATAAEEAFRALSDAHAASTHDRNQELEILHEVLDIVRNQLTGLRQYAEDYIANH